MVLVKAIFHGPEMRCSVRRVVSGFKSTAKTGSSSFQALQDTNVSWPCLYCDALNYHSVALNILEDLIISNRFEFLCPIEGSSLQHHTF